MNSDYVVVFLSAAQDQHAALKLVATSYKLLRGSYTFIVQVDGALLNGSPGIAFGVANTCIAKKLNCLHSFDNDRRSQLTRLYVAKYLVQLTGL